MTPSEQLGLFTSLRALAMGEFCGAIVPQESAPAPVDVEVSEEEEDSEWPNPIGAVPTVKRKRGRPRTREPMIGPKRPRGRPRLPENMLRERRGKPIGAQISANNVHMSIMSMSTLPFSLQRARSHFGLALEYLGCRQPSRASRRR